MTTPVLHLLAGPNGSGKSTLATRVIQPQTHLPFINADVIAAERWSGEELEHSYEAAQVAEGARQELLKAREPFITETVFSHRSKVELVEQASSLGYIVYLHVVMVPVSVALARVEHRVRHGGHDVPRAKVRARYKRLWPLVVAARDIADRTTFYDNENDKRPFRTVALFARGQLVGEPDWPAWTPTVLTRV